MVNVGRKTCKLMSSGRICLLPLPSYSGELGGGRGLKGRESKARGGDEMVFIFEIEPEHVGYYRKSAEIQY